jgi:hypothetical protein
MPRLEARFRSFLLFGLGCEIGDEESDVAFDEGLMTPEQ